MKLNNKLFKKQGYIHIEDVIPMDMLKLARRESINLKRNTTTAFNKVGSIDMASKVNENLMMCYIHPFMQQIVPVFLETKDIWLFNDQAVVKLPNEDFTHPEHYDNKSDDYKTVNYIWVLTNSTKESGALEIKNNKTGKWELLEANAGDLIVIEGKTLYRSNKNTTDKPRAMYACTFSDAEHKSDGFHDMKWRFCNCRDGLNNHKLDNDDQNLWEKYLNKS